MEDLKAIIFSYDPNNDGDCRAIGGEAVIAVLTLGLASNSCPQPGPSLPLRTAQRT